MGYGPTMAIDIGRRSAQKRQATVKTLAEIRAAILDFSRDLDPASRYVRELLEIADASADAVDFEARLDRGCRGQWHAGAEVFADMPLADKIRTNLVTSETALFRFTEGEIQAVERHLFPQLAGGTVRILVVPCSHGEEAFTLAAFFLKRGVDFRIRAFDLLPALVEEARSGRLTFGYPLEHLRQPGFVAGDVLERIEFGVGDAFNLPLGPPCRGDPFELVVCRNFLGYFVPEKAAGLARDLAGRVAPGGALFLDSFCLAKTPGIARALGEAGLARFEGRAVFCRSGRPGQPGHSA